MKNEHESVVRELQFRSDDMGKRLARLEAAGPINRANMLSPRNSQQVSSTLQPAKQEPLGFIASSRIGTVDSIAVVQQQPSRKA